MIDFRNMDCMELMAEYPDNYFDLAIVDPPYGLERFKKGGSRINKHGGTDKQWNNTKPSKEYFEELFRISKKQIIWGANNFDLPTSEYFIVWDKMNPAGFSFAMCEQAWTNCKVPAKIVTINNADINRHHPTQKPVRLYTWLLANYAKKGDLILDTHVGSASSLIACHKMGFDVVGCELDKEYYDLSTERIKNETLQIKMELL